MATKLLLICCLLKVVIAYRHEKPIHKSLTMDRCHKGEKRLNDCNWCYCENTYYKCKARVCTEVDMFGHFNDAIQDINVGMEGHGVWRSAPTACDPGVKYEKDEIICICTANGTWPNPTCRDTFRVLHSVEVSPLSKVDEPVKASNSSCEANKLYLIGCNVCFCPESGQIDPKLCTRNECHHDDPVLNPQPKQDEVKTADGLEVYAECNITTEYEIGCMKCVCLRNNRLVCESCDESTELSLCSNKTQNEVFNVDCNQCSCDEIGFMYCTTKRCLKSDEKESIEIVKATENHLRLNYDVKPGIVTYDIDCVPNTWFDKNCNKCYCLLRDGKTRASCTMKECTDYSMYYGFLDLRSTKQQCVLGTAYQSGCLKCRCDLVAGEKIETCLKDSECDSARNIKGVDNYSSLNGHCEPKHIYTWDCNTCRCLPDGETVTCTSKVCPKDQHQPPKDEPIIVDIIPIRGPAGYKCPKDHTYKIDCNTCYCLDNGNAICTSKKCE